MLTVTDIITFKLCPKKLYAIKKFGYRDPTTSSMLFGTIAHEIIEKLYLYERDILISPHNSYEHVVQKFTKKFSRILSQIVSKYRKEFDNL